jgi:predicted HTH domain antitoxin
LKSKVKKLSYTITIDIPSEAFSALRQNPDEFAREMLEAALCKWYEQAKISQSKAAEIANLSRFEFLEVLKKHGVSPFQYSSADLERYVHL